MIRRPVRSFISSSRAALAAASIAVCAASWTVPGDALAQASGTPVVTGQKYAVKPGQSLNDVAGELTGSKDRDVRQKMARALYDANPNAFGNHDINKLKLGSTLDVPVMDAGAAGGATAASEPAAQSNAAAPASTPAQTETPAPAPAATTATAASESGTASASSAESASAAEPQQAAPASEATLAPAPAPTPSRTGPDPMLFGIGIAVLVGLFLLFKMRGGKKRRSAKPAPTPAPSDDPRAPRTFASLEEAQADADARNEALRRERERAAAASAGAAAANLETETVQRGQSELNTVTASIDSDDAAKAETTPTEDETPTAIPEAHAAPSESSQPHHSEPFTPRALAAHHAGFVPPTVTASTEAEAHARESEAREAAAREAQKWESQEREAATRQAAVHDAEERERHACETTAREALARELQLLAEEACEAVENEEEAQRAREAAAREIIAHEAELRDAQARAAEEKAAEQRAVDEADSDAREGEILPGLRFPMPKFPQEAIQALDSLDLNLPPRMELTLNLPGGTVTSSSHGTQSEPPRASSPIEAAPYVPHPAAAARPLRRPNDESVVTQIEAGTAGAASVAGLGATHFPPLSLDFDINLPKSQSAPLTFAQLAAIARNKLELAGEYIELGDLPGARTLLQEVIASNDPATRQKAATLLSTLARHS